MKGFTLSNVLKIVLLFFLQSNLSDADCPSNDVPVNNTVISIIPDSMTCKEAFDFTVSNSLFGPTYACRNEKFKLSCCNFCQIFESIPRCENSLENCDDLFGECSEEETKNKCPVTCGQCKFEPVSCDDITCKNGGTCKSAETSADGYVKFKCECQSGFTGNLCERCSGDNCQKPTTSPPKPTVKNTYPPKPTVENTNPPKPTVENTYPPKPTVENTYPPKPTVENTYPPKPTVENTYPPKPTVENTYPPKPTVENTYPPKPAPRCHTTKRCRRHTTKRCHGHLNSYHLGAF